MTTRPRLSPRAEEMFALIETYLASGLSPKIFCEQHHLTLSTLQYWRRKYTTHMRQGDAPTSQDLQFIPLRARQRRLSVPAPAQWVIEFPHGVIVRLSGTMDIQLLSQLIHSAGH